MPNINVYLTDNEVAAIREYFNDPTRPWPQRQNRSALIRDALRLYLLMPEPVRRMTDTEVTQLLWRGYLAAPKTEEQESWELYKRRLYGNPPVADTPLG